MKFKFLTLAIVTIFIGCGSASQNNSSNVVADDYGYSEKNPVKVGGISNGPTNERNYLYRLTGINGEPVTFVRRGSCCHFESKSATFGMGMLDVYEVKIKGDTIKKILYLNMYEKDKLYAPKGFLLK